MTELVSDSDHISRFCRRNSVDEDGRITGQAFKLRPLDQEGLSVNWLEYLNLSNRETEIKEVRKIYKKKLDVTGRSRIAVLNVGETRKYIYDKSPDKRKIQVTNDKPSPDLSHRRITGSLSVDDTIIFNLLAEVADKESYPAQDP